MKSRKSTVKKMMLQSNSSSSSRAFSQEIFKCPMSMQGCSAVFIGGSALLHHLECECSYFISKASDQIKHNQENKQIPQKGSSPQKQPKEKVNLTRLLINKVKGTPSLESIDQKFTPCKFAQNYSIQTKKPDRMPKMAIFKRIDLIKEIDDTESLELGSVPMKSNLVCIFNISKNKSVKTFVAFRSSNFTIILKEINGLITKRLEGHQDHITEIKYFKNERDENLLYSSSFDNTLIVWNLETYQKYLSIDFDTWVLSSSLVLLKKQNSSLAIVAGGYYKKYPIKVYNLADGLNEFDIPVTENISIEIIETYVDEESGKYYLFVGSDIDKPKVLWFDFRLKTLLGAFPATANVTCLAPDFTNKASLLIYSDSNGVLKQVDLSTLKITLDFKCNSPILDCIIWDPDYFIVSGSPKDNSIKILTRYKTRVLKTFENLHNKVIVNISKIFQVHNGVCIMTVGGDRKIRISKMM